RQGGRLPHLRDLVVLDSEEEKERVGIVPGTGELYLENAVGPSEGLHFGKGPRLQFHRGQVCLVGPSGQQLAVEKLIHRDDPSGPGPLVSRGPQWWGQAPEDGVATAFGAVGIERSQIELDTQYADVSVRPDHEPVVGRRVEEELLWGRNGGHDLPLIPPTIAGSC